jgi:hypothetical protein
MSTASHGPHQSAGANQSAASSTQHVAEPMATETAAECLKHAPRGALVLSSVSVGLLFVGWLAFYFFLFMPRGPID